MKKVPVFEKIEQFANNKSLRWRIMLCVFISLVFMAALLLVSLRITYSSVEVLGDSYKSNSELNNFSQNLAETEKALETYLNYHTFESIDNFYSNRTKDEEFIQTMQKQPSTNEVAQKEYIVYQLSRSFISYSSKAIAARRANNSEEVVYYYKKTSDSYNLLLSQLLELNKLLLQQNAEQYNENHRSIISTTQLSISFFFAFGLVIFLIIYLTITSLTQPLKEISSVAHRVSKRDFDVPLFNRNTNDEIGNICRAFDRMIISIREYIDTIWEKARTEAELKEKEIEMQALYTDAQLRALQNQINPHFLFNTLNTGAQLAMMEGADKTCYFIEQVADFFRYNIQQQKQTATIDEELGLVENFVYIMKVRFGNRLEFEKNIPDCKFNEEIPVMTLQPLIENSIKHGLKNTKGKVNLDVVAEEKYITISISDNGSGMPDEVKENVFLAVNSETTRLPAEILNLNKEPELDVTEKHTGTGLVNVFLRLKLYFHRDDIFDITSGKDGVGTTFIIRIPRNV